MVTLKMEEAKNYDLNRSEKRETTCLTKEVHTKVQIISAEVQARFMINVNITQIALLCIYNDL